MTNSTASYGSPDLLDEATGRLWELKLSRLAATFETMARSASEAAAALREYRRRFPWYNRLRWRLDSLTRRYLPAVSSTRAMRRLRVWVERAVDELEST